MRQIIRLTVSKDFIVAVSLRLEEIMNDIKLSEEKMTTVTNPSLLPCLRHRPRKRLNLPIKSYCIAQERTPPYPMTAMIGQNFHGRPKREFRVTDEAYQPLRAFYEPVSNLPAKQWSIPIEEIDSVDFMISILQNEAVRCHRPSGFVYASLIYNMLENSGVFCFLRQFRLDDSTLRGIAELTFDQVSSGRGVMTDALCAEVFLRKLAVNLKKELPQKKHSLSARKLWHMINSAIFFNKCKDFFDNLEEAKKYAISLSRNLIARQGKGDRPKNLRFVMQL